MQERPKEIDAEILRFDNKKPYYDDKKWISVIGLINEKPYEIYTGWGENLWIPRYVQKGKIIEVKSPENILRYDFQFEDKKGNKTTIGALPKHFDEKYWDHSHFVSSMLKNKIPLKAIKNIVDELDFETETMQAWKYGMNFTLEHYMQKGIQ